MSEFGTTIMDGRAQFLAERGNNYTSQYGEDGLIQAVFELIGETNRWCFEMGAADGVMCSNTRQLFEKGWEGLLIEGDPDQYQRLTQLAHKQAITLNRWVKHDGLDEALRWAGAPAVPDFGVIDIDGQDYWVWQGMTDHRPRVMLVEFSPYGNKPDFLCELRGEGQAGLNPIRRLGEEKGYVALCHTYCNVLFVLKDEWERVAPDPLPEKESPDEIKPGRGASKATRLLKRRPATRD